MDIKLHAPTGTMVSLGWSNRLGGGGGGEGGGGGGGGGGRGRGAGGGGDEGIPSESLFQLYGVGGDTAGGSGRNQVTAACTYTRGFELWQHQQQILRHQQQQQQQQYSFYPPSAGLLNFGDPVGAGGSSRRGDSGGIGAIEFGMRGRGGGGGLSCQDCGNQSKKDCAHMRCRTCCKSRGFHCPTHVKSTWIPASKRRERQQLAATAATLQQQPQYSALGGGGGGGGEPSKRPREITTRLPTVITTTSTGNGAPEAPNFPAEVSSPVVFRSVRVSPLDEADDELAYQTEVSIQGHVFKGILYDYGPEAHRAGESSSSSAAAGAVLTASTTTTTMAVGTSLSAAAVPAVDAVAVTAGLLDTTASLYPPPFGSFMAGTQFFPHHPRP